MKIIKRILQERIEEKFFQRKVIIIYGARQVGKTTLIKEIRKKYLDDSLYFNCDEPDIRDDFINATSTELKSLIKNKKLIFILLIQYIFNTFKYIFYFLNPDPSSPVVPPSISTAFPNE